MRVLIRTDLRIEALNLYSTYGERGFAPWQSTSVPDICNEVLEEADAHSGASRAGNFQDNPKVRKAKPNQDALFNGRTLTVVSSEHMLEFADEIGLPVRKIEDHENGPVTEYLARMLAANVLLGGSGETFKRFMPGTQMFFGDDDQPLQGAITLEGYIDPCRKPALQLWHSLKGIGFRPRVDFNPFKQIVKSALAERRGWAGWVSVFDEPIQIGQDVTLHQPNLPPSRQAA